MRDGVAGVDILDRTALAGRDPAGCRVIGSADLPAPGVAGPCIKSARRAAYHAGRSIVSIDVAGRPGPSARSPDCRTSRPKGGSVQSGIAAPVRRQTPAPKITPTGFVGSPEPAHSE